MEEGSPTFPLPITWVMQIRCPLLFTLIHTHTYTVEHLSVEREIQPAWIWRQRGESRHPSFIIIPIFSLSLLNWLPKHTKCIFKIIYEFSRGQRRAVDQHDVSRALFPPSLSWSSFSRPQDTNWGDYAKSWSKNRNLGSRMLFFFFFFLSCLGDSCCPCRREFVHARLRHEIIEIENYPLTFPAGSSRDDFYRSDSIIIAPKRRHQLN